MKILAFTHPQVVLNLFLRLNTRRYFEGQSSPNSWFPTVWRGRKILWMSMGSIDCLVTDLQNIFFCIQQKKHL